MYHKHWLWLACLGLLSKRTVRASIETNNDVSTSSDTQVVSVYRGETLWIPVHEGHYRYSLDKSQGLHRTFMNRDWFSTDFSTDAHSGELVHVATEGTTPEIFCVTVTGTFTAISANELRNCSNSQCCIFNAFFGQVFIYLNIFFEHGCLRACTHVKACRHFGPFGDRVWSIVHFSIIIFFYYHWIVRLNEVSDLRRKPRLLEESRREK